MHISLKQQQLCMTNLHAGQILLHVMLSPLPADVHVPHAAELHCSLACCAA